MNTKHFFQAALAFALAAICTTGYAQSNTTNESATAPKTADSADATEHDNDVFYIVEKMPTFPGGDLALRKHIAENIVYPQEAKDQKLQGKVFVTFVIGKDGFVEPESVKIATDSDGVYRGVHPALDAEAIRIVRNLPKWEPGTQFGKPLRVSYTVPINFQIK